MSFFDDIKAKAEELLGGATEQISSNVEDVTNQAGELGDQAQNIKDSILPGEGQDSEGK